MDGLFVVCKSLAAGKVADANWTEEFVLVTPLVCGVLWVEMEPAPEPERLNCKHSRFNLFPFF